MILSRSFRSVGVFRLLILLVLHSQLKLLLSINAAAFANKNQSENLSNGSKALSTKSQAFTVSTNLTSMQQAFEKIFRGELEPQNFLAIIDSTFKSLTNNQISFGELLKPNDPAMDIRSILLNAIPPEKMVNIQSKILKEVPPEVMTDLQTRVIQAVPMEKLIEIVTSELSEVEF